MKGLGAAVRMILGGAMCGSFLGIFAGGVLGALSGGLWGDVSLGLDGALLGGCVGCLLGAGYGAILAAREVVPGRDTDQAVPTFDTGRENHLPVATAMRTLAHSSTSLEGPARPEAG